MALNYDQLMGLPPLETRQAYQARDVMLYALGVGAGQEAGRDLALTYEAGLQALPTMAVTLAHPGFWLSAPELGLDWKRLLHGEQTLEIHRPLATSGEVVGVTTVEAIFDKGAGRGALLYTRRQVRARESGDLIATVGTGYFLRGDGGFGGSAEGAPIPHPTPETRPPDARLTLPTRPEQALIYRLSGDYNPLHAAPAAAREAGFETPILHGLCTYGFAGRAAITALCGDEPARLRRFDVRFSSPVFPGETLEVDIWREGAGRAALRARAVERDVVVLRNGYVEFVA